MKLFISQVFRKYSVKISKLVFFAFLFNLTAHAAAEIEETEKQKSQSVYQMLAELHLPSLTKQKAEETKAAEKAREENRKNYNDMLKKKQKKLSNVSISEIGSVEKLEQLYALFASDDKGLEQNDVLSVDTLKSLEFFCGSNPKKPNRNLFATLDRAQTTAGKIELQQMMAQPLTDPKEIKKRQEIIQALVQDDALFDNVGKQLETIAKSEAMLLWFCKEMEEEVGKYFEQVYMSTYFKIPTRKFNNNEAMLEFHNLKQTVWAPFFKIIQPALVVTAIAGGFASLFNYIHYTDDYHDVEYQNSPNSHQHYNSQGNRVQEQYTAKPYPKLSNYVNVKNILRPGLYSAFIMHLPINPSFRNFAKTWRPCFPPGTPIDEKSNFYKNPIHSIPGGVFATVLAISAIFNFITIYGFMNSYKAAKKFNGITNQIQDRLISVASLSLAVKELGDIVDDNPTLKQHLASESELFANVVSDSKETADVVEALATSTFKGDASFFSNKGRVLATFKHMFDTAKSFTHSLRTVGQLDALRSVAAVVREHASNKNAHFCKVNFIEKAATPYAKVDGLWHIYLDPKTVVTNNLEIGNGYRNIALTGPNAGGKSTYLQGCIDFMIFAQAFGWGPAQTATMTPFAKIVSYLNISDHIGEESLFQAEMNRVSEFLNMIKGLAADEFCFVIMDEMFTGTNPKEGEAGAYGVAKRLSDFHNIIGLLATHFPKLTELEQATNGLYKNFKVDVILPTDGSKKLKYTYKVVPGKADQAIALYMLSNASGFDSAIMDAAYSALNSSAKNDFVVTQAAR